jgi:hypothetical protein|tara:strand:+ start:1374 stop:1577 length:204 start_codon:yes stop_codon:yes gene_type:complete
MHKIAYQIKVKYSTNLDIIIIMKIYIIWLIGVILWNFGVPNARPIEDVIVAILLSFLSIGLKKYLKF